MQVWASITLILTALPTWQYLNDEADRLPVFPLIAIIYGIYFGLVAFLPFEPYGRMGDVAQASQDKAAFYGMIGTLGMTLGYRLLPSPPHLPGRAEIPGFGLEAPRSRGLLFLMGIVGVVANFLSFIFTIPVALGAVVNLGIEMAVLSIALFFHLHLTARATVWERLFLWAFLVPSMVATVLATSLIGPLIRLFVLLLMVYIYSKHTFPIRFLLIGGVLLFPLLAFKAEYRKIEILGTAGKFGSVTNVFDKASLFTKVVSETVVHGDREIASDGLEAIAQRVDMLDYFAYITEVSPSLVPYLYGASYRDLPWKFIPRILYLNKPLETAANEVGHRYGLLDDSDDQTAVNMPQLIELYINFGPWGILPGMVAIGLIYKLLKNILLRAGSGPIPSIIVIFLFTTLINVESQFSGVFGNLVFSVVIFSIIGSVLQSRESSPLHTEAHV